MDVIRSVDVAVIGAGTMGSQALWQLSKQTGASVLGIEMFGPAHSYGAFSGESRLFRVAIKEGGIYTEAALRARELWIELEAESGREVLLKTGVLAVAPGGHPFLESTLKSIDAFELPHDVLTAAQLRRRYPQYYIEDRDVGVLDAWGGALRPEVAVATALRRAVAQGAEMLYDTTVLAIDEQADAVLIRTSAGVIRAGKVVVTSGAWSTAVMPELSDLLQTATYALTWFMPDDISQFTPDRFPGFMRDLDEHHAFGAPTLDGYSVKISPSIHLPLVDHPEHRTTEITREQLIESARIAQAMFPGIVPEPVRWSTHPDSTTIDHVPIIDVSSSGRVVIAAGMSGNGFKFAPTYGRVVADLIESGSSALQLPMFTLEHHRRRADARRAGDTVDGGDAILATH